MFTFKKLRFEDIDMVLSWRKLAHVNEAMFTRVDSDLQSQQLWFQKIEKDTSVRYWVINFNSIPIGLINISQIDLLNSRCTLGYYIGELEYRGAAGIIPAYIYNYIFKKLSLNKIYGEVLSTNKTILEIHKAHGYRVVGVYRNHVIKDGVKHDVVLIELLSDIWISKLRYSRYEAIFE